MSTGLKYTKDHEWIELSGDRGKVGITDYAQKQLGDVVYVELPDVGTMLKKLGGGGRPVLGPAPVTLSPRLGRRPPQEPTAPCQSFEKSISSARVQSSSP